MGKVESVDGVVGAGAKTHALDFHAAALKARPRLAEMLAEALRVPSVSGEEGACATWFASQLARLDVEVKVWEPGGDELTAHPAYVQQWASYEGRPNVIATRHGSGGGKRLILNGHTDVVPVDQPTAWTHGPWSGDRVGDRIYGRGAVDMKGGCVVAVVLLELVEQLGIQLRGDLSVHLVVDEEATGNGTLAAVQAGLYQAPSACVILEPTGPGVMLAASRGARYFRVVIPGREVATEYQATEPNAILKAVPLLEAIEQYRITRESSATHPLYGARYQTGYAMARVPLAVCKVNAGAWPSTLPANCVLEGTIECLPGEDIDSVALDFSRYLHATASADSWLAANPISVEFFGLRYESAATTTTDPFVVLASSVVASVIGQEPLVIGGPGSDLRHPVLYANCPTLLYGPSGGPFHATDEWVSLDEMVLTLEVCLRLAVQWCDTEVEGNSLTTAA